MTSRHVSGYLTNWEISDIVIGQANQLDTLNPSMTSLPSFRLGLDPHRPYQLIFLILFALRKQFYGAGKHANEPRAPASDVPVSGEAKSKTNLFDTYC